MSIGGDIAAGMLDQQQIAIVFQFIAGIADGAAGGGVDRRSHRGCDIDAVIALAIGGGAEGRNHFAAGRPGKRSRAALFALIRSGLAHWRVVLRTGLGFDRCVCLIAVAIDVSARFGAGFVLNGRRRRTIAVVGNTIIHAPAKFGFGRIGGAGGEQRHRCAERNHQGQFDAAVHFHAFCTNVSKRIMFVKGKKDFKPERLGEFRFKTSFITAPGFGAVFPAPPYPSDSCAAASPQYDHYKPRPDRCR